MRDRYGRNRWGQSVLLARRLVEAGVSLVQVNWTRMTEDTGDSPAWDTHSQKRRESQDGLMPIMDQAYSALLEDLQQRGLLDETLVVWMGEFGRTPKINGGRRPRPLGPCLLGGPGRRRRARRTGTWRHRTRLAVGHATAGCRRRTWRRRSFIVSASRPIRKFTTR